MKSKTTADLPTLQALVEAGTHFGHRRERSTPAAQKYTFVVRDGVSVINLEETQKQLLEAVHYLEDKVSGGATVLFVGTKRQAAKAIKDVADRIGMPSVSTRWLGGTLTNFAVIRKNIDRLVSMEKILSDEALRTNHTKRELARMQDAADKLHTNLDGIATMTRLPDMLLVVDPREEQTAVHEANRMGIPVIALCDTDVNPDAFFLPIPANDDAPKAIELILNFLGDAIARGKEKQKTPTA